MRKALIVSLSMAIALVLLAGCTGGAQDDGSPYLLHDSGMNITNKDGIIDRYSLVEEAGYAGVAKWRSASNSYTVKGVPFAYVIGGVQFDELLFEELSLQNMHGATYSLNRAATAEEKATLLAYLDDAFGKGTCLEDEPDSQIYMWYEDERHTIYYYALSENLMIGQFYTLDAE